ncbi:RidA family protein [Shewanella nanhaiensis]|uniref:RidA family protein n=1 Tax=Shewanella nanhaiensis TaxID=2864872 RepID=A0ABS7E5M8_9GAMM|nr:RidA family protein [Shewanella nanhaiensis]MBW8184991.1 RidA family protein [Shewanella nanhaiensis]
MSTALNTQSAPAAIGPYVQGVDLGNMVFTSGQLPIDPVTGEMSDDVAEQAYQSLKNVQAIVEAAELTMNQVFKMTVFVKDLNNFPIVNEVYQKFFDELGARYPARSCVEVARLPKDAQIEIEAIAVRS